MIAGIIVLILGLSALDQAPQVEGDPALYDLLRAAQATNAAQFQSGRLSTTLNVMIGTDKALIVEDIEWLGPDYRASYQIVDPAGIIEGVRYPEQDLSKVARRRLLVAGNKVYGHSVKANAVYISKADKNPVRYLDLTPQDCWFLVNPDQGRPGRSWTEMIGPHPAFPTKNVASYAVTREGSDLIKLIRRDRDGVIIQSIFSIKYGMNVISNAAS